MLDKEMKIDKKAVGLRIKQIRMNKGYTLEEFGKLFEANKSIVLRWENGTSLPHKGRLISISKLANLSVNELLYGDSGKDIEELYQALIKLPRGEFINLMMRVAIEIEGVKDE